MTTPDEPYWDTTDAEIKTSTALDVDVARQMNADCEDPS